jgi:hydrogenase maturation protease
VGTRKIDYAVIDVDIHSPPAILGVGKSHSMKNIPRPTLILGIGNLLLGDDGIGVRAVQMLRERSLPESVELVEGGTRGIALTDELFGRRKVIVLDALDAGGEAGSIYRLEEGQLEGQAEGGLSLHDFGLLEALEMARLLGQAPDDVVLFGVQPKEVGLGRDLSPEVSGALPELVERVVAEVSAR